VGRYLSPARRMLLAQDLRRALRRESPAPEDLLLENRP
jgi:hypothetical protein